MDTKNLQRKRCRNVAPSPCDEPACALHGLPPRSRIVSSVLLPLSLRQHPRAFLVRKPDGSLLWRVRLPGSQGAPQWHSLESRTPERWAWSSGLPGLAIALCGIRESAEAPRTQGTPSPGTRP